MNYFQLFGLTEQFSIDTKQLPEAYQSLQKSVHPDRFAHASSQDQLLAVQKSAMINDAYQTLKHPINRAQYLLKLRNTEMPSEQASFGDTQFLMRQMELREMLEDISQASDIESAIETADTLLAQEFASLLETTKAKLAENTTEANIAASQDVRKLKFYQKLQIELERLEDKLLDD